MRDTRAWHIDRIAYSLNHHSNDAQAEAIVSTIEAMIAEARTETATVSVSTDLLSALARRAENAAKQRDDALAELATLRASMGEVVGYRVKLPDGCTVTWMPNNIRPLAACKTRALAYGLPTQELHLGREVRREDVG